MPLSTLRNIQGNARLAILLILITIVAVYHEPFLMPRYKEFVDQKTMIQSFTLLEHYKRSGISDSCSDRDYN